VPNRWIETSRSLADQLGATTTDRYLVHADLHYGNVLAGTREPWLAIDPKPLAGDAEHAVPELLWTRADELEDSASVRRLLEVIVENGALDAEKARNWCIVRCVDAWLWGIEHGLTEDPKRCQQVLQALL
jgi:streptomycin 6-kinase